MFQTSISTVPPTASKTFFISSASSLLTFSFTFWGRDSTNFLAWKDKDKDIKMTRWQAYIYLLGNFQ